LVVTHDRPLFGFANRIVHTGPGIYVERPFHGLAFLQRKALGQGV